MLAAADRLSAFLSTVQSKYSFEVRQQPEEQLRGPFENLLRQTIEALDLHSEVVGEVSLGRVRPDFAIAIPEIATVTGVVELKAPGVGVAGPEFKSKRNRVQWQRLSALPNVLYSDGREWALFRNGQLSSAVVSIPDDEFVGRRPPTPGTIEAVDLLLHDFILWEPEPLRSPIRLAETAARLCRILRAVTLETLDESGTSTESQLQGLAQDWRDLLFPDATDESFADSFAQTVTFGLLLARAQGIDFGGKGIREIADELSKSYSLIGRALDVVATTRLGLDATLAIMKRVFEFVDWGEFEDADGERAWLYFYEDFLEAYDADLKKSSGSYYTPEPVVASMARLAEEALRSRLSIEDGFASPAVHILDPAMGTGTFLLEVIEQCRTRVAESLGPGAPRQELRSLAGRLIGFERMTGPYAVAHLRLHGALRRAGVELSDDLVRIYVADTLADPYTEQTRLGGVYEPIAKSRREADRVKREEPVMVVLGNPPYKDKAKGRGGWVENGSPGSAAMPILTDFIPPSEWGVSTHVKHLYNMNVYFWRWALWKAFEAHQEQSDGVVALITTSAFLNGKGFQKMRAHIRSLATEVWVIDLSPEGHRASVPSRIFPKVQQPLSITIICREGSRPSDTPAKVWYRSLAPGSREAKFEQLAAVSLHDDGWTAVSESPRDSFRSSNGAWDELPTLEDLLPWTGGGVMPGRNWVVAPTKEVLQRRWRTLTSSELSSPRRAELFVEHPRDRRIDKPIRDALPGYAPNLTTIGLENGALPEPVRIGFRSFDRQWIIPDKRLINRPNPSLWYVRSEDQVFLTFSHDKPLVEGPAVVLSPNIPDMDYYHGRGGRVAALWRDPAGVEPNLPPELLMWLESRFGHRYVARDMFAYLVCVMGRRYTEWYNANLRQPGPRVPLTGNAELFKRAVEVGHALMTIQLSDKQSDWPDCAAVAAKLLTPIADTTDGAPHTIEFADDTLVIGDGRIGPVSPAAWGYSINGYRAIRGWFRTRSSKPSGKKSSELDHVGVRRWSSDLTRDLILLLRRLETLIAYESEQAEVFEAIVGDRLITTQDLESANVLPAPAMVTRKPEIPGDLGPLFDGN